MNLRQRMQLAGALTFAFLGVVVLVVHPELMLLAPFGYGASWLRRIRARRIWVERVEEFVSGRRRGATTKPGGEGLPLA